MAYVTSPEFVEKCLGSLLSQRIHPHFAGYLCLKRTEARDEAEIGLRPDFREFFETFFAVPNAPHRKPYVRPFWDEQKSSRKAWYQPNVAGSYSPRSARRIRSFMEVIDIDGNGRTATYSLRPKHWELARQHLVFGNQVDAVALAGFLYRDFGLLSETPSAGILVQVFRDEFGFGADNNVQFSTLFRDDSEAGDSSDWFIRTPEAEF